MFLIQLRCVFISFFFVGIVGTASAQVDTLRPASSLKSFIAPASLMTAGLVTQGHLSRQIRTEVRGQFPQFHTKVDDYIQYVPSIMPLALSAAGIRGKHGWKDQLILLVLSQGVSNSITQGLKYIVAYPRPNGEDNHSFPSGHTTFAFTGAAVLAKEYSHRSAWYGIAGYGMASSVAVMRVLNDKHWVADVLFGAGVSIASTEAVYLVYPWIQKKIFKRENLAIMPYYNGVTFGFIAAKRL